MYSIASLWNNCWSRPRVPGPRSNKCITSDGTDVPMPWMLAFASLVHFFHHALHWFTHFSEHVQRWMYAGGYFVLFGLLFACGLGLPLPEDIPLLVAGAMVATGRMHLALAAVCAWCGIIGGDIVLYHLGKKFGLEVTRIPVIGS